MHPKKLSWCGKMPCVNDTSKYDPTRYVKSFDTPRKVQAIYNLRGNVSEWSSEDNLIFGGSWGSSC